MDNLTHSLFGLTLARTPLCRAGRGRTVALLLASNAPDIDIVTTAGGVASYLQWHRGPTHGPLGVVGLAVVAAGIVWVGTRWSGEKAGDPRASFLQLWLISTVGVLCHVLMDLPTSYGTRPLSPLSWTWFAEDWMPIVDIYLLAILGAGVFFGRTGAISGGSPHSRNAAIVLGLMLANYGVRAAAHHQAISLAPRVFAGQLPERCDDAVPLGEWIDRWPRASTRSPRDQATRRCLLEIAAMPNFLSPLKWRLIARLSNAYEIRDVSLLEAAGPTSNALRGALRYPNQWTPAVVNAARSPIAQVFLGFSRFPAARSNLDAQGNATVRWSDMRFVMNPLGDQRPQSGLMFGTTVRVGPDGFVLDQRFGP